MDGAINLMYPVHEIARFHGRESQSTEIIVELNAFSWSCNLLIINYLTTNTVGHFAPPS